MPRSARSSRLLTGDQARATKSRRGPAQLAAVQGSCKLGSLEGMPDDLRVQVPLTPHAQGVAMVRAAGVLSRRVFGA